MLLRFLRPAERIVFPALWEYLIAKFFATSYIDPASNSIKLFETIINCTMRNALAKYSSRQSLL